MAVVVARQGRTLYEIEGYARAIMSDVSVTKIDADRVLISFGLNKKGLTEFCNNGIKKFFPAGYIVPLPCPIGNLDDLRRAEHALIAIGDQGTSIAQLAEHPMELLRSCERVAGQGRVLHCRSGKPSAGKAGQKHPGQDQATWVRVHVLGSAAARQLHDKVVEIPDAKGSRVGHARILLDRETFLKVTPNDQYALFKLTKFNTIVGVPMREVLAESMAQMLELGGDQVGLAEQAETLVYYNENARIPKGQLRDALVAIRVPDWKPAKVAEAIAHGQAALGEALFQTLGNLDIEWTQSECLDSFELTAEEAGQEAEMVQPLSLEDLNRPAPRKSATQPTAQLTARERAGIIREPPQPGNLMSYNLMSHRVVAPPPETAELKEDVRALSRAIQTLQEQIAVLSAGRSPPPSPAEPQPPQQPSKAVAGAAVPAPALAPAAAATPLSPSKKQKRAEEDKTEAAGGDEAEFDLDEYSIEENVKK
jgi:hypothetical protein